MLTNCTFELLPGKEYFLKSASGISFQVFSSVENVPRSDWDLLAGSNLFLSINYLESLDLFPPPNMTFRYVLILEENRPVGIAYYQLIKVQGSGLSKNFPEVEIFDSCYFHSKSLDLIKRKTSLLTFNILVGGNSFISGPHGVAFVKEMNEEKAFEIYSGLSYMLGKYDRMDGKISAVLVKDFYSNEPVQKKFKKNRFHEFTVEPDMIFNLNKNWSTFKDYQLALHSKYKKRSDTIVKKSESVIRKEFTATDIVANAAKIRELYTQVHENAKFKLAYVSPFYFSSLKEKITDKFQFHGYYHNDELIAFRTGFVYDSTLLAHFIGFDYSVNKPLDLYQNILYDYVEEAISHKALKLVYGRTAAEIKSNIGARPHNLYCYIRHRNALSNEFIGPFLSYLRPSDWIQRNPVKEH